MTTCQFCNKQKKTTEFMPSSGAFWASGHINICYSCVEKMVDGNDLNQVDRLFQFANMAFMPQEWRKIWKREGKAAFRKYSNNYYDFNYYKYDWGEQNEKLMDLARKGLVETEVEELKPELIRNLKIRWGNLEEYDLLWLENYYNSILADYNVQAETQRDQFRKICRMSLTIDKMLQQGQIDKDFMTQYNNFMTSALKNVEKNQSGAITSVGQIVEFIERNGYKAKFYDGISRDEIDRIIENMKEYVGDLVRGETNLPEIYAQVKQKYDRMSGDKAKAALEALESGAEDLNIDANADDEIDVEDYEV